MNSRVKLEKKSLKGGTSLFRQGEEANTAYLIQQGTINIIQLVGEEKHEIGSLTTGDIIGERALLPNTRHSNSAEVSQGGAIVVAIDKRTLRNKYSKIDPMVKNIIESLIKRLENSNITRLSK